MVPALTRRTRLTKGRKREGHIPSLEKKERAELPRDPAAPAESSQGGASFLGGGRRAGVIGPVCTQGALVSRFPLIRAALCPSATASPTPWPGARTGAHWGSEVELSRWCPAATDT